MVQKNSWCTILEPSTEIKAFWLTKLPTVGVGNATRIPSAGYTLRIGFAETHMKRQGWHSGLYAFPTDGALALEDVQQRGHDISWSRTETNENGRGLSLRSQKGSKSQWGTSWHYEKRKQGEPWAPSSWTISLTWMWRCDHQRQRPGGCWDLQAQQEMEGGQGKAEGMCDLRP